MGSHRIGPSHIGLRLARCESGKGLLALMGGQLARAAELDAAIRARLRPSPVRARISSARTRQARPRRSASAGRAGAAAASCSNYKPSYPLGATLLALAAVGFQAVEKIRTSGSPD